jgi:hypothetical protein
MDMKKHLFAFLVLMGFSLQIYAQDTSRPDTTPPILPTYGSSIAEEGDATVIDSIPIPVEYTPSVVDNDWTSPVLWSFADSVVWSPTNKFGFTVGANEGYVTNVYSESAGKRSTSLTSLSASAFANLGRGESVLHLGYDAGYRFYQREDSLNGIDHSGNFFYSRPLNRRARLQLTDSLHSSVNDPLSDIDFSFQAIPGVNWGYNSYYDALFSAQRITRNNARANIDINLTNSTQFNVFGQYDNYWYEKQFANNIYAVSVGAGLSQRITNWLSLSTAYSVSLNDVAEEFRSIKIHRVEVGNLHFHLSPTIEVSVGGGLEIADINDEYKFQEMITASISRMKDTNQLFASYQRSMTSVLGFYRVLPSDTISVGLGQRISQKTNVRLVGSYMRSSDFDDSGLLRSYSASASFEYALTSNLFASANYTYQYQNNSIGVLNYIPHFDRSMVFAGIQYVWPSLKFGQE